MTTPTYATIFHGTDERLVEHRLATTAGCTGAYPRP